jgi:hypothetical protein
MENKETINSEEELELDGSFAEPLGPEEIKLKMKTFHKKHDEDMSFYCRRCNKKISAHNKDWHDSMCDGCFNKEYFK